MVGGIRDDPPFWELDERVAAASVVLVQTIVIYVREGGFKGFFVIKYRRQQRYSIEAVGLVANERFTKSGVVLMPPFVVDTGARSVSNGPQASFFEHGYGVKIAREEIALCLYSVSMEQISYLVRKEIVDPCFPSGLRSLMVPGLMLHG